MAEDAVDAAIKSGKLKPANGCVTDRLRIVGGYGWEPSSFTILAQHYVRMKKTHGGKVIPGVMDSAVSKHLSHAYGILAERVATIAQVGFLWTSFAHILIKEEHPTCFLLPWLFFIHMRVDIIFCSCPVH